jgi:hypothetical protein
MKLLFITLLLTLTTTSEIPLEEWQQNYSSGLYNNPDLDTQISAGWFDWFCEEEELSERLQPLASIVSKLKNSTKIDVTTMYVFFENKQPVDKDIYDDFKICSLNSDTVYYTVVLNSPYEDFKWTVYGYENNFSEAIVNFNKDSDLVEWLND